MNARSLENRRGVAHFLAGFIALAIVIAARGEEGGSGHYAPGSFASFIDALPGEPSIGAFNYFTYYNGSGDINRRFPIAGQIALNVDGPPTRIASAHSGSRHLRSLAPIMPRESHSRSSGRTSMRSDATRRSHGESERFGQRPRRHRVLAGGAELDRERDLHVNFFGGIYAPSGEFKQNRLANQGLGYWTFEPGVLVSYLGTKNGFEASTYIGYDFNTKNTTADYQSGQAVPH